MLPRNLLGFWDNWAWVVAARRNEQVRMEIILLIIVWWLIIRAIDGARSRDLRLGKPTLYQLSYYRDCVCKYNKKGRSIERPLFILFNLKGNDTCCGDLKDQVSRFLIYAGTVKIGQFDLIGILKGIVVAGLVAGKDLT